MITPKTAEKLLTVDEVAERLSVNRFTVYKWLYAKKLRGYKAGRAWRISLKDLTDFMKEGVQ
ncbi:helix-turn-helix domain-containing protein [Actinotignum sp. GS-2025e]|uniref:helix-turn-helix domain-containing protein n=1 Tax=unclassified Actinotignum TaxID=2632702 RepID=UPI003F45F250